MTDETTGLPAGSTNVAVNAEYEVTSYTNSQGRLTICIPSCGKIKPNHQASPGPIGNTVGIVVPQTSPNASGAGNSAPTPRPTEAEEGWWSSWGSDLTHGLLDIVGLIPLAGELADGLNGLIYLAEGDKVNAGLSFAMMLPVGGQAATALKWGKKGVDAAEDAAARAAKEKAEKETKEGAKDGGWVDAQNSEHSVGAMARREYQAAPYHGKNDSTVKSKAPTNGQDALDMSVQVKDTSPRRIGIDYNTREFTVFDQTSSGIFHGHVRSWNKLTPQMQNALRRAGMVDKKGNILGGRQ